MRVAAISRVVPVPPDVVARRLTPRAVIEAEGRYLVDTVQWDGEGRRIVTVEPTGRILVPQFVVEDRPDGFVYRRTGEGRLPLVLETTVRLSPEGEGTRVDFASTVEAALPLPLVGEAFARKRRRELGRLAARLDDIVG